MGGCFVGPQAKYPGPGQVNKRKKHLKYTLHRSDKCFITQDDFMEMNGVCLRAAAQYLMFFDTFSSASELFFSTNECVSFFRSSASFTVFVRVSCR